MAVYQTIRVKGAGDMNVSKGKEIPRANKVEAKLVDIRDGQRDNNGSCGSSGVWISINLYTP